MKFTHLIAAGTLASLVASAALPAAAATSLAGGAFAPASSGSAAGAVLTTEIPGAPLNTQASIAVPLSGGGRYAITGEVRTPGPQHLGLGAGVGKLDSNGKAGVVFNAVASTPIAPGTSVTARFYQGVASAIGTSGFLGLAFTL